MKYATVIDEKIVAEHPLSDQEMQYMLHIGTPQSIKESVASAYECVRNEIAKACVKFSDDEALWNMARTHGMVYRSIDVDSVVDAEMFLARCSSTLDALTARKELLSEKRWYNS